MKEAKAARAAELFSQGKSVNAVAKQLGIAWTDAKKLKPGGVSAKAAPETPADEPAATAEPEAAADVERVWPIALEIPAERIGDVITALDAAEMKAAVFEFLDGAAQSIVYQAVLALRLKELLREAAEA